MGLWSYLVEGGKSDIALDGALSGNLVDGTRGHLDGGHLHGGAANELPLLLIRVRREVLMESVAKLDDSFVTDRISKRMEESYIPQQQTIDGLVGHTAVSHMSLGSDRPADGTSGTKARLGVGSVDPISPSVLEVRQLAVLNQLINSNI